MRIKKKFIFIAVLTAVLLLCFCAAACAPTQEGGNESGGNVSGGSESGGESDSGLKREGLRLSASNSVNTATAYFTAEYTREGIYLRAEVADSDVYDTVYYSYGYDDNVEYVINVEDRSESRWDTAQTFHFLITSDGETYLQRAAAPSAFGESYALDLLCVYGGNFSYSAEYTDYGYKTEVFLGYDLLNTTAEQAYGNITVCPAMRNTHDYSDSVWKYYSGSGCNWNKVSSFIKIDETGKYVVDEDYAVDYLFVGDGALETSAWLTQNSDMRVYSFAVLSVNGSGVGYWKSNIAAIADYSPENIVLFAGSEDLKTKSAKEAAAETKLLVDGIHEVLPESRILVTSVIAFGFADAEVCVNANRLIREYCLSAEYARFVDLAAEIMTDGVRRAGFFRADGSGLNQMGYNVWTSKIRETVGVTVDNSDVFGNGSIFYSSVGVKDVTEAERTVTVLDGDNDQYTYFKGCGAAEFYATADIRAQKVYGSDLYPKFGLVVSSGEESLFFYIDGSGDLTEKKVGYVRYEGNHTWQWQNSVETAAEIRYTGTDSCTLSVLRYGGYIFLSVNGQTVFTVADIFGAVTTDVGILSFNTRISLGSAAYVTENLSDFLSD